MSVIDVIIVKKSETRRPVWVYTFCICPKVPFRMTLANVFDYQFKFLIKYITFRLTKALSMLCKYSILIYHENHTNVNLITGKIYF